MREGAVGAEVDRQYPTLMFSESLTNEYALWPILQYGELFVIIVEVSSFNMRFQLSWFKHVTLNHGTAGSSPARRTICLVSLMDKTEDFYSPALGSTPGRGTIYEFSSAGQSAWLRTSRSGVRISQLVPCGLTKVRFRCIYRAFAPLTYNG